MTDDCKLLALCGGELDALAHGGVQTNFGLPNYFCFVIACPLRHIGVVADNKNVEVARSVDNAVGAVFCQDDSLCWG